MAPQEINYWLMKSEPDAYSIKDLRNENPGGPYKKILRESHGMII